MEEASLETVAVVEPDTAEVVVVDVPEDGAVEEAEIAEVTLVVTAVEDVVDVVL